MHHSRSDWQDILVFDNAHFGRVLALDGCFQLSTTDEATYHELLVHPALCCTTRPQRVLVIGGGDGGTIRQVFRHPSVQRCVMVELDAEVVEVCRAHMPAIGADAWQDPRLELRVEDGVRYVHEAASSSFDAVLVDGPDAHGPARDLFGEPFFEQCRRLLRPGGTLAIHSGAFTIETDGFYRLQAILRRVFEQVHVASAPMALFGNGHWTWTMASMASTPAHLDVARAEALAAEGEVYDAITHLGLFHLPLYVRRRLAASTPTAQAGQTG